MRRTALFIALSLGVGRAMAGCTLDENQVRHVSFINVYDEVSELLIMDDSASPFGIAVYRDIVSSI